MESKASAMPAVPKKAMPGGVIGSAKFRPSGKGWSNTVIGTKAELEEAKSIAPPKSGASSPDTPATKFDALWAA